MHVTCVSAPVLCREEVKEEAEESEEDSSDSEPSTPQKDELPDTKPPQSLFDLSEGKRAKLRELEASTSTSHPTSRESNLPPLFMNKMMFCRWFSV